jgi:transcriptional regulator with XRE-family HTH domain
MLLKKNMTQTDLANALGCSVARLNHYLNCHCKFTVELVGKIAVALDISSEYLLSGEIIKI